MSTRFPDMAEAAQKGNLNDLFQASKNGNSFKASKVLAYVNNYYILEFCEIPSNAFSRKTGQMRLDLEDAISAARNVNDFISAVKGYEAFLRGE